jgi:hypothetical protein
MTTRNLDQSKFVADAGGASKVGAFLRRSNPFNARTFRSREEATNELANLFVDANNKASGQTREMEKRVAQIKQLAKDLSDEQLKDLISVVQKEFSDKVLDRSTKVFKVRTKDGDETEFLTQKEADDYANTLINQGVEVDEVFQATANTETKLLDLTNGLQVLKEEYNKIKDSKAQANVTRAAELKQQIARLTDEIQQLRSSKTPSFKEAVIRLADGDEKLAEKMKVIARKMEVMLKEANRADELAGNTYDARENYFAHVRNYTEKELAKLVQNFANDPQIGELVSKSTRNKFAKERKSYQTMAEVDNALSALQEQQKAFTRDSEEYLNLQKKIDVLSNLYERDPFTALTKRLKKSIQTNVMRDMQKSFIDNGAIIIAKEGSPKNVPAGFIELDAKQASALNLPPGTFMNEEVFNGISKVKDIFTSKNMQKLFEGLESLTNIFKTMTTTVIPAHYTYNIIGSYANNFMAEVSNSSYKKAYQLLRANSKGEITKEQKKIIDDMLERGVLNQTSYADFLSSAFTDNPAKKNVLQRVEDWTTNNAYSRFMRNKVGDPIDNLFRVAHYLDVLEKTRNPKMAADSVRKFLFNYQELTKADRVMKLGIPFWNWTKNNVPLQIEMALTAPRFVVQYERMKEDLQGNILDDPNIPDYVKDGFLRFGDTLYNPRFPLQDLEILSDPRKLASSTNPMFRSPVELFTNQKIFSGGAIDYDMYYNRSDSYFENPQKLLKYLADQTGITGRAYKGFESTLGEEADKKPWYQDFAELALTGTTKSVKDLREDKKDKKSKKKEKEEPPINRFKNIRYY